MHKKNLTKIHVLTVSMKTVINVFGLSSVNNSDLTGRIVVLLLLQINKKRQLTTDVSIIR